MLLDRIAGEDTDPIDLLPIVVLFTLVWSVHRLQKQIAEVLKEIVATKERVNLKDEIREALRKPRD